MAHLAHYKEAHPLPFNVTHWINLVCVVLLVLSGFIIHYPYLAGLTGLCRGLHVFCGIILVLNCIVRIILAFLVQSAPTGGTRNTVRDYKTWLPQKDNRHQGIPWIKYYFFIKKDHPLSAKLGVPQKISYLCVPVLILFMGFTGFSLWNVTNGVGPFAAFVVAMGGIMYVRMLHFFLMFVFICFAMLHIYLVLIEGTALAKNMLFRKEHNGLVYDPNRHVVVGEDNSLE